jgi:DUF4097 and DUF4098 domain-containing protein YvlB
MKTLIMFLTLFVSLSFITASFAQTDLIKEQTLATSYGKNLSVSVPGGDVKITTWNKEEAYVKITGNENAKNKYDFTINSNSGDIEVKGEKKNDDKTSNITIKVEISVPDKFNAKVSTAGGDIKIDNSLTGEVKLNTAGGDITVSSVTGTCKFNTAGGDIKVQNFKGDIKANTAGGNINLNGSEGEVTANTSGGEVELKYTGENKGITLNTMGGNILIYLPSDFKADCNFTTMNGVIKSDIVISGEKSDDKSEENKTLKGKMNGGGNSLKCATMGGNITVKSL